MNKTKVFWLVAIAAVVIIGLCALLGGTKAQAAVGLSCGQTVTKSALVDSTSAGITIKFEALRTQIDVFATDPDLTVTKVEVDFVNPLTVDWVEVATGPVDNFNPPGGTFLTALRVTAKTADCPPPVVPSTPSSSDDNKSNKGGSYAGVCYYLLKADMPCNPELQKFWGNPEFREWVLQEWRNAMCTKHDIFCKE